MSVSSHYIIEFVMVMVVISVVCSISTGAGSIYPNFANSHGPHDERINYGCVFLLSEDIPNFVQAKIL